jgi:predicted RNA binding protein YcfA (HicA-like mRNA interferase family)
VSRREKLIERIRRRPAEANVDEVTRLLQQFGWELDRRQGSHMTFTKPGERPFTFPLVSGRMVKRSYLVKLYDLLGLDD